MYSALLPVVAVAVLSSLIGNSLQSEQDKVFLLGHQFDQYDFSCRNKLFAALSEDKLSVLFYDVLNQSLVKEEKLNLQGQLLKWSLEQDVLVIAHDSYVTVLHISTGQMKTISTPVVFTASLVVVDGLACLFPTYGQWTNVVCVNTATLEVKTCAYSIYEGNVAATSVNNWVYSVDEDLSPQSMYRFIVANGCLNYTRQNPNFGQYSYGQHIWYSYDGSRIFLDNGLTLTASADPQTDMTPHGDFDSSYGEYNYNWFAQSIDSPYTIAGLRSDQNVTLNLYSWPYLTANGTRAIPLPKNATGIYENEQVQYCLDSILVFTTYSMPGGVLETGIAYVSD